MCGIVGYRSIKPVAADMVQLVRTLDLMRHRGPDDRGFAFIQQSQASYVDRHQLSRASLDSRNHSIALGHVRFSIVDLSDAGHQPFVTDDGRICLTFNGEIYNYVEVRRELESEGYSFRTRTDTEVLAKAYQRWGVDCFRRLTGFWALALYDFKLQRLLLARDRIGKAPLYFCQDKGGLYWASELKVLLEFVPEERRNIRVESVAHFANWLRKDFGDTTFYRNIRTFPAASYAWVQADGSFRPESYWSLPAERLSESQLPVAEAAEQFNSLMSESVRIRHRADVPVAVQLSGGMDSSTLVAKAAQVGDSVDAYTVKYGYGDQDEEPYARSVAEMYRDKVRYHIVHPSEDDFVGQLMDYTRMMDEPYHSPNQLSNQHIWKQMADHGLRVVLYGGGGDEVFAGYAAEYFPPYLRSLIKTGKPLKFLSEFFSCTEYQPGIALKDYAIMLGKLFPAVPRRSTHGRIRFIPSAVNPLAGEIVDLCRLSPPNELEERLHQNMRDWRMNYWLRIDNQNSLSVPVELRCPFLDHRVIEFAFRLPQGYLIRDGWMKWIVRKSMEGQLPSNVVWRRTKMGFPFPLKDWLLKNRRRLRQQVEGIVCPYVDGDRLFEHMDELCAIDAEYVWGLIAILLWWKYSVNEGATSPRF